jgi:hypothetical protein
MVVILSIRIVFLALFDSKESHRVLESFDPDFNSIITKSTNHRNPYHKV